MKIGELNFRWAMTLVHGLFAQGVSHAVISPGSRSTPLALACEKHPWITTRVIVDERCAAYFASGYARYTHKAVLLICTSGTALANWLPGVIEASHNNIPLILLTADRPAELHNIGSNQTIDQDDFFTPWRRYTFNLPAAKPEFLTSNYLCQVVCQMYAHLQWPVCGPVHLNIPLAEPLLPEANSSIELNRLIEKITGEITASELKPCALTETEAVSNDISSIVEACKKDRGLIICGDLQPEPHFVNCLQKLSELAGLPIIADPLSNLRQQPELSDALVVSYDLFLRKPENERMKPGFIIQFGRFPVSGTLLKFIQRSAAKLYFISPDPVCNNPAQLEASHFRINPSSFCELLSDALTLQKIDIPVPSSWPALWREVDHTARKLIAVSYSKQPFLYEGTIVSTLLRHCPDSLLLFAGNSMPVRELDTFMLPELLSSTALNVYANRGVSGIDGNLSTFAGMLAAKPGQYGIILIGDLSLYHDMNALQILQQLQLSGYNASIVLINNNGGGIFHYLPQHQLDDFTRLWKTPLNIDFSHCAGLYALNYALIKSHTELEQQLPVLINKPGINLIECRIDSLASTNTHHNLWKTDHELD